MKYLNRLYMAKIKEARARVIAMYLPQYYPIPENDNFWGKGFTEWNNVAKARPLFKGHHQPNIPADLGFYDLRLPEIREQQAQLAREAGVEGFMYWHYWMGNDRRLLNRPIDEVLESGKPDFPFCFGWANHEWKTSTWTTKKNFQKDHIICPMVYSEDDYIAHFNWCLKAFNDPRYIKVDGKPFFLIYSSQTLPDPQLFFNLWNKLARENGFPGIHFVSLASGYDDFMDKQLSQGFDAAVHGNFWQALVKSSTSWFWYALKSKIRQKIDWISLDRYKYKDFIKYLVNDNDKRDNIYPCLIPGWDRSPRSGRKAVIVHGSTPELWKQHVSEAVKAVQHKDDEHKIVILRSWNEWGEGNYVEPDERWGTAYLDALRDVLFDK